MTGYPALAEASQQIQSLLFPPAPGPFSVDMQDFHFSACRELIPVS
jgi:hypothetical protein